MKTAIMVLIIFMIPAAACPDDLLWFENYALRASEIRAIRLIWDHNGDVSPSRYPCEGLGFRINVLVDNKWMPIQFIETRGCGAENYKIAYKTAQEWVNKNLNKLQIKAQKKR